MKNTQLKEPAPVYKHNRPVFSWFKHYGFPYGYKWVLTYGITGENVLAIECACDLHPSLQKQVKKDISLKLRQARKHLRREWHKRNPSSKTMYMFKVEALTPDGWSDDASLLGFGTSQDDNRWPSKDAALAACVEMCDVMDPRRLRVVPVDG